MAKICKLAKELVEEQPNETGRSVKDVGEYKLIINILFRGTIC